MLSQVAGLLWASQSQRRNAVSKVKMVVGLVVILFCLLGGVGYAQGELTLEGLAERIEELESLVYVSEIRIYEVIEDTPAYDAGLRSADIILSIDDKTVDSYTTLVDLLAEYEPGDEVTLTISRFNVTSEESEELSYDVVLADHPNEKGRAYLGVNVPNTQTLEGLLRVSRSLDHFDKRLSELESVQYHDGMVLDDEGACRIAKNERLQPTTIAKFLETYPNADLPETALKTVWVLSDSTVVVRHGMRFSALDGAEFVDEYWDGCEFLYSSEWQE